MRYYAFVNMYIKGIQAGIQAGHCLNEIWWLSAANSERSICLSKLMEFNRYKTFILLNGGDGANLRAIRSSLSAIRQASCGPTTQESAGELPDKLEHIYPYSSFNEHGLDGALTCVGVVLPERMYGEDARQTGYSSNTNPCGECSLSPQIKTTFSAEEIEFLKLMVKCPLAT